MKTLRYLVVVPTIIILGLVAVVLAIPSLLYMVSLRIYSTILRMVCWAVGHHTYDIYAALMADNLEDLRCTCCQTPLPKENLLEITRKRDDLKNQITFVAKHIQETQETNEISNELGKLE